MTLPIAEFIGRYLLHVPAPGTRVVRSYGLYAPTKREALAVAGRSWGKGRWTRPWCWTGRRRAASRVRSIRNAVPSVVNGWSAAA